jgi:WD40 repeat protein
MAEAPFDARLEERASLPGHLGPVGALGWAPRAGLLLAGDRAGGVRLWDLGAGSSTLVGTTGVVRSVAISADGDEAVSGDEAGNITVWDLARRVPRILVPTEQRVVASLAFSPTRPVLASGGWEQDVRLWELPSGRLAGTVLEDAWMVESIGFARDGRLAAGARDGSVFVWGQDGGEPEATLMLRPGVSAVAFSPDGKWLAAGNLTGSVVLWNTRTYRMQAILDGAGSEVRVVAFSPDGSLMAIGSGDAQHGRPGALDQWHVPSSRLLSRVGADGDVLAAVFESNERLVTGAVRGDPNGLVVWGVVKTPRAVAARTAAERPGTP